MEYAEFFSCLTIHFHTKGTYFFEIVPIVYEASRAKLKKGAVGRRLGEDNSHLSNQSFHNITKTMSVFSNTKFSSGHPGASY